LFQIFARRFVLLFFHLFLRFTWVAQGTPNSPKSFDCLLSRTSVSSLQHLFRHLQEVLVERGDRVEKGQKIARLQSAPEEAKFSTCCGARKKTTPRLSARRLA